MEEITQFEEQTDQESGTRRYDFKDLWDQLHCEWKEESLKYEQTIDSPYTKDNTTKIPRRNYANPTATLDDPSLFPYHASCYPLLHAYDALYERDFTGRPMQPIAPTAVDPKSIIYQAMGGARHYEWEGRTWPRLLLQHDQDDSDNESDVPCFVLCDFQVIMAVLFQRRLVDPAVLGSRPCNMPDRYIDQLTELLQSSSTLPSPKPHLDPIFYDETLPPLVALDHVPPLPPVGSVERTELWLRLLKHALAELQRDHLLAGGLLVRLATDGSLQNVSTLQRVLVILLSDYVFCDVVNCENDHDPDHICDMWQLLLQLLPHVLCYGVGDCLTRDHARTMLAWVRFAYDRELGPLEDLASSSTSTTDDSTSFTKLRLKRALRANRLEDRNELDPREGGCHSPTRFFFCLIRALGMRGELEVARIAALVDNSETIPPEKLAQYVDSYHNCLATLVAIGNLSVQVLPPSERLYQIASLAVRSITASLVSQDVDKSIMNYKYTFYLGAPKFPQLESISLSPLRLARRIQQATKLERDHSFPLAITRYDPQSEEAATTTMTDDEKDRPIDWSTTLGVACQAILKGRPDQHIRDSVRMWYLRDAVYMSVAGLGYGDFVVWCRFRIQPLDPVLYYHDCNHIMPGEIEDENDDDGETTDEESEDQEAEFRKPLDWAENEVSNARQVYSFRHRGPMG